MTAFTGGRNKQAIKQVSRLRPLSSLLLSYGLFVLAAPPAHANEQQCRALHAELASLANRHDDGQAKQNPEFERYSNLVERQAAALKNARKDAIALQCVSRSGTKTDQGHPSCPALLTKIGKMEVNLQNLVRRKEGAARIGGGAVQNSRAQQRTLRARLERLNCDTPSREQKALRQQNESEDTTPRRVGFLERLFGRSETRTSRYSTPEVVRDSTIEIPLRDTDSYGGVYRTLCVRICDGYYYPIRFATIRRSFDADEAACQASNPNTEARLFFHSNPGETPEDMRDLAGRLYAELPNAFRYRREIANEPSCPIFANRKGTIQTVADEVLDEALQARKALYGNVYGRYEDEAPRPAAKPLFFSDEDTALAIAGQFELKPVSATGKEAVENPAEIIAYDPARIHEKGIRVIGPTFLDDQQSVKLLLTPDQIQVQ